VRWHGGTAVAGVVVLLVMLVGFFAQQRITTGAFDRLEADQVALDAQRVRIGLEARAALLSNYGSTNSIWDTSYDDVLKGDRAAFAADFPPADLTGMYGVDGAFGLGLDGTLRVEGSPRGTGTSRPLPA
jgi:sensor domain CHASE-containing protein